MSEVCVHTVGMSTVKDEVVRQITEKFIAAIEAGLEGNWERPWASITGAASNAVTGKTYQGFNWFLLSLEEGDGKVGPWATYKQWEGIGAQVRKGEHGTQVLRPMIVPDKKAIAAGKEGATFVLFKAYRVFAASQVDGYTPEPLPEPTGESSDEAEAWLKAWSAQADLRYGGDRAFYSPTQDFVQVPERKAFATVAGFFGTVTHEAGHWTGHSSRLDRADHQTWGDHTYAYEELIAELCSSIMAHELGIDDEGTNTARYLESWLKALKSEDGPKLLYKAASDAQKAANLLIKVTASQEVAA